MSKAPTPRPAQIEVLVGGADLPLAPIDPEILEVMAEVLGYAFDTLSKEHLDVLRAGTEAEVNGLMRGRLNDFLHPHDTGNPAWGGLLTTLWRQLARSVVLGQETPSHDGSHLEKRPDLNIQLTNRHPSFPLVAECKLIDAAHGKSARMYCDNGVARFPSGEYGWASREAFMLAYVRDGTSLLAEISRLLALLEVGDTTDRSVDRYKVLQAPDVVPSVLSGLSRSTHGRSFKYSTGINVDKEPGPIQLWHLELAVPNEESSR